MFRKSITPIAIKKSEFRSAAQQKVIAAPNWWKLNPPLLNISGPRIVFSRFTADNGGMQIYSMNSDGFNQQNLSQSTNQDDTPAISSQNGLVAFSRGTGGYTGSLYTMNADGSAQSAITNSPAGSFDNEPAWSYDGKFIAFQRFYQIWIANADGTNPRPLMDYTQPPYVGDSSPTWSPDGTEVAFWRQQGGTGAIMAVKIAPGSTPTYVTLPSPNYFDGYPAWSPDGVWIAFWRNDYTQLAIWKTPADGQGQPVNLSKPDYQHGVCDRTPCWSPDGGQIAFARTLWVSYDIWIMNAKDGSAQQNISNGQGGHCDFFPSWHNY